MCTLEKLEVRLSCIRDEYSNIDLYLLSKQSCSMAMSM